MHEPPPTEKGSFAAQNSIFSNVTLLAPVKLKTREMVGIVILAFVMSVPLGGMK